MRTRDLIGEVMDDPALAPGRHRAALQGLRRINAFSGAAGAIWRAIRPLARGRPATTPLRVLDIATGAGDIPIALWRRAARAGIALELAGCDVSERALAFAQEAADRAGASVRFFRCDVTDPHGESDWRGPWDVITCSLFLHHLEDATAVAVLARMGRQAGRGVVVSDLRRSRAGYLLAACGSRVLSRCDVVHTDARRSVRAAFTLDEARQLALQAGLVNVRVRRRWPQRWLLTAVGRER